MGNAARGSGGLLEDAARAVGAAGSTLWGSVGIGGRGWESTGLAGCDEFAEGGLSARRIRSAGGKTRLPNATVLSSRNWYPRGSKVGHRLVPEASVNSPK